MQSLLVQTTSKIKALARCGRIEDARELFDKLPLRDCIAWNSMISGYTHLGHHKDAISLFIYMRASNVKPDHFTFTSVLSACSGIKEIQTGEKLHSLSIVSGNITSLPVNNALIDMYGKCLRPYKAKRVFEEMGFVKNGISWCSLLFAYVNANDFENAHGVFYSMPEKMTVAWNTLIAGHMQCGEAEMCMDLFKKMVVDNAGVDEFTLSAVMCACADSRELCWGCIVHGFILKSGWSSAVEVSNSIISFYAGFNCQKEVLNSVKGMQIFTQVSWNAIIDAHMKVGSVREARKVFEEAPEKNIVSWTSMINGLAINGFGELALSYFVDMVTHGLKPDNFTFGSVLHACSNMVVYGHGRMVHQCAVKYGFHDFSYVGNGLVNMYAKCGDVGSSYKAFYDIVEKDLISWNTMVFAFGMHGWTSEALLLLDKMTASSVKPDEVTFIGLLMTCSHSGLIEKGLELYKIMSHVYSISPGIDHMACMMDMFCRAGHLERSNKFAKKHLQACGESISSCEALLGVCSLHNNMQMGTYLGQILQTADPLNEMSYVLLSNLYCASGKWKEAEMVRNKMADQGVIKMPGLSWVEMKSEIQAFVAGDQSSPVLPDLSEILIVIDSEMRYPISMI
ncbi:hypothetical protein LIER_37072 [Lithospermum erythrorhizon]|uniref:Pentatricopeptide repeat-containing protein n=1 Tax=Lithospermum erythrorhizon TaxID=34254 RepID=A0AAV3PHJ5_LITER